MPSSSEVAKRARRSIREEMMLGRKIEISFETNFTVKRDRKGTKGNKREQRATSSR